MRTSFCSAGALLVSFFMLGSAWAASPVSVAAAAHPHVVPLPSHSAPAPAPSAPAPAPSAHVPSVIHVVSSHAGSSVTPRPLTSDATYREAQKLEVHKQIADAKIAVAAQGKSNVLEPVIHQVLERMNAPLYGMPVTVNAAGERVVRVYHGGTIEDGTPFAISASKDWSGPRGVYFTTDLALAEEYAGRSAGPGNDGRIFALDIPVSHFAPDGARARLDAFTATRATDPSSDHSVMDLVLASYDGSHRGQWGVFTDADYVNTLKRTFVRPVTTQEFWDGVRARQGKQTQQSP